MLFIEEPHANDEIDVLEEHRVRNHAVQPPNTFADSNEYSSEPEDVNNPDETEEPSAQRARRYSKTPRDAEPKATTMKYYPPHWQAVLEIAKNNMRKHVALVNAFPRRDRDLKEATLILQNTIAEYERIEGNILEPGHFGYYLNLFVINHML